MANKQALRELQTRLAERLQQVRVEQRGLSWLAVRSGGQDLLLPLQQAGEIFDVAGVVPVPHTQAWLMGVVNLRGGVYTVVDLAVFLGLRAAGEPQPRERGRLLAFSGSLGVNAALLIDQLLGLRHAADMQPDEDEAPAAGAATAGAARRGRPAFAAGRWRDGTGRRWQELSLVELAAEPQFLAVGR